MKDFKDEYLDIIKSIEEQSHDTDMGKTGSLPKINLTSKNTAHRPLARPKKLAKRDKKVDLDYEEATLPLMKADVFARPTFVDDAQEGKNQVQFPKQKKHQIIPLLIILIIAFLAVYSATKLTLWNIENEKSEEQFDKINSLIVETVIPPNEPDPTPDDSPQTGEEPETPSTTEPVNPPKTDYSRLPLVDVDFTKLMAVNPDTVAYIKINGLDIAAPIVQTVDNDFYLNHSYDKTPNSAGWIFGDYRNDWKNLKTNTIVYGHNRQNYRMFGSLKLILDEKWNKNKDNHYIYISTHEENMIFEMFSAYTIPTETYYLTNSFSSKEEYQEFLTTITARTQVDFGASVSTDDKIITLSTCYTNTTKTVVHGKLVKSQKRNS